MACLRFAKLSPGGNSTVCVTGPDSLFTALTPERRVSLAEILMDSQHLTAEQVGFLRLEPPTLLDMMGGEFCVNAARSAALLMYRHNLLDPFDGHSEYTGTLACSGLDEPLPVRVLTGNSSHLADCSVRVPLAPSPVLVPVEQGAILVRLPGISHLMLATELHPFPEDPTATAREWRQRCGMDKEEAAGVVWHTPCGETRSIVPLVRVRDIGSEVLESACGSASLALSLCLNHDLAVRQASGEDIHVRLERTGAAVTGAWVGGKVRLVAEGEAYVEADWLQE